MGSIGEHQRLNVKSICIIGAGPSGLVAAKYFLAEHAFSHITIYEQRPRLGGLWNYSASPDEDGKRFSVPQTEDDATLENASILTGTNGELNSEKTKAKAAFMSPVYDRLETNIPRELMGFSDLDWPEDCQLFPEHERVLDYIEEHAEDVKHLVQFETKVLDVSRTADEKWLVKTKKLESATVEERTFDAVLVANGHFNVPYVPNIKGMREWNAQHPGSIVHSMYYRKPEDYTGRKVVVVGNSASGVDIAAQIVTTCQKPLLQSQKSISQFTSGSTADITQKPEIIEYIPDNQTLRFADGTVEKDVDAVVYCTGYFYSYPFLHSLEPPITTTGEHVENTFQHIFYRPHPTLAFAVLNQKVIPFPIAEAQAAVVARVWSGRLDLPGEAEMLEWERKTLKETGGGRNFHLLKFPKDADYVNMLHDWAMSSRGESCASIKSLHELHRRRMSRESRDSATPEKISASHACKLNEEQRTTGKEPPYWGEKEYWMRERFPAIKKAFNDFGEDRHGKRTLEDVGFCFEEWKGERVEEGRRLL